MQLQATKYMVLETNEVIEQDCYLDTNGLLISGITPIEFDFPTLIEDEYVVDENGVTYTALPYAVLQMLQDEGKDLEDEYGNGIAIYYE